MKGLVPALLIAVSTAHGQTTLTDNFDLSAGVGFKLGADAGPGPVILPGDPYAGNYLRLVTDGIQSQVNHWVYPSLAPGGYDNITTEFDFRGIDAMTNQSADGFHCMLVPTAYYDVYGDGPNVTAEEPNITNAFAVGFDFHPADGGAPVNDVSAHWDGYEHVNHRAPTNAIKLDNQQFHHAKIELTRVGNSSVARVTLTPDVSGVAGAPWVAFQQMLPLMFPYENRIQLGARTGGRDMSVDIDNLSVSWDSPTMASIPTLVTNRLLQDFDTLGTTKATAGQHTGSDTTWFRPGVLPMDSGTGRGVYARLVHDLVNSSRNSLAFHQAGPSLAPSQITSFDFRMQSAGNSADGLGFLFLPTRAHGVAGGVNNATFGNYAFEEPNLANTLAVGLDLYDQVNDVSVHYNGAERTNVRVDPTLIDLNSGQWHRAVVTNEVVPGGMKVSVALTPDIDGTPGTPVSAIVDQFVPGLSPYEWRALLGARTGGSYMNVDVDNIGAVPGPKDTSLGHTYQDFDTGHTYYEAWKQPAANTTPLAILNDGAANGNYLRLTTTNQTNCRNAISFDRAPDGGLTGPGKVTILDFDFRATEYNTNGIPADGLGFLLIPTATYGPTGEGAFYQSGFPDPEEPNLIGALAVGVDLYDKRAGVNDVSVHWDGWEMQNVTLDPATQVSLSDGFFHHAKLVVNWGAADSAVTLVVTSNSLVQPGPPLVVIDNMTILGLAGYDYRVEVAARTGGQTCALDLDNIQVRTLATNSYAAWIARFHGLLPQQRDPDADPEGDGQPNLVEYFAATDPTSAQGQLIQSAVSETSSITFEFRRSTNIPDLTYAYEWSTDLQEWFPADANHVFTEMFITGDGTYDLVRATLATTPPEPRVFARLRITLP